MKRFSFVCCLVLLLNMFCPAVHVHAEEITTPTDLPCEHTHYSQLMYDSTHHWYLCDSCGEIVDDTYGVHESDCTDPDVCRYCKAAGATNQTGVVIGQTGHRGEPAWEFDSTTHTQFCPSCGEVYMSETQHIAYCYAEDTSVCLSCGAENVETRLIHGEGIIHYDENVHWNGCAHCGEPFGDKSTHHLLCDSTDWTKCSICGVALDAENVEVRHVESDAGWEYDEDSHWRNVCVCGEMADQYPHYVSCADPDGGCTECGYVGGTAEISHNYATEYIDAEWHKKICVDCGDEYTETHWAFGCLTNICIDCGAEFENTSPNHWWEEMQYDANGHWYTCIDCGKTVEPEAHWYSCADPGTCLNCGYVATGATNYSHYWTDTFQSDNPDYHYKKCIECGEKYDILAHFVSCANPGVCTGCGATGLDMEADGHGDVEWQHNDTKHWGVCTICGEQLKESKHWTDCSKPDMCQDCGAENVTIDPSILSHFDVDWGNYESNATHHWYTCRTCNVKAFYAEHYVDCYGQQVACAECGVVGDFDVKHEALKQGWETDTTNHWKICAACEGVANKEAHMDENADAKCDVCSMAMPEEEKEHTHVWKETGKTAATCTAAGVTDYACEECEETKQEIVAATGHAWGEAVIVEATCTTEGSKTIACTKCEEKTVEAIKATGHNFGDAVIVEPTCTAEGSKTSVCTACGEKATEAIPATGHAFGDAVIVEPTCTAEGSKTGVCTACGEKATETIPATGHTFGEAVIVEPTCTAEGSKTGVCKACGEEATETIPATGHTFGEAVIVEPTCTTEGSKTDACTACGEKTTEVIPATGEHNWETTSNIAATCTAAGSVVKACTMCGEKATTTIDAKGHDYGLVFITEGNGTHAKSCAACGEKHVERCNLTSTELGNMVCSACATCGYAVYTMSDAALDTVEGLTDAEAEIEVKRVENVTFEVVVEPAAEGETEVAEPFDYSDVVLVVHETALEMTVELPEIVNASVKKVLAVSLLKEGSAIQPSGKLKLSIPVVEEEVTGLKLVLMTEDGELIEIEYEIIDGVMVFETELVGVFLLVDAEE